MKKYTIIFLLTALVTTSLTGTIVLFSKFIQKKASYYGSLEKYQFSKLSEKKNVDTIFVGDSSLGNAIDVKEFDAITGTHSINLALTGIYGYAGTYNLIKRALRINPIKNVFIIHTLDIMKRPVDYRAFLLTAEKFYDDRIPFNIQKNIAIALATEALDRKSVGGAFFPRTTGGNDKQKYVIANDYHPQEAPLSHRYSSNHFDNDTISPTINAEQMAFLNLIGGLCHQQKITCVYAFGPILNKIHSNSDQMVKNSTAAIAAAGIPLADNTPYLLDFSELGDSTDHVDPSRKTHVTRYYANILKRYITQHQTDAQ
ncbi:hypothetical protein [Nitratidesulfovibrio liaohensis]|uniref:Uncharacterized protein n=1 Tax=Nitratidesulfovibrio liaohensis TaxID=2604158 RepID=A0ABY9QZP6_9BACT|nr:hypothetical protein [Nitratidesulfovibrio liaohensis]WMW63989.1 hypothetical protein KPS_001962 [Nitratidesulfovibrio liaohensis]